MITNNQTPFPTIFNPLGDAGVAICPPASCGRHLCHVGFTKGSVCHRPLSTHHNNFPGSKVTDLCSALWKGRNTSSLCQVASIDLVKMVFMCNDFSEFRGSRRLCDSEVQPGRSSLSEPAALQPQPCRRYWVKLLLVWHQNQTLT